MSAQIKDTSADCPLIPDSPPLLFWPSSPILPSTLSTFACAVKRHRGRPNGIPTYRIPDAHGPEPPNETYLLVSARLHTAWSSSAWPALLASGDIRVIRFARPETSAGFWAVWNSGINRESGSPRRRANEGSPRVFSSEGEQRDMTRILQMDVDR
jgi:hypothetical protein